ncbi:hypothetical protein EYF80_018517 [Liparis tanakae]|uniref:Uncharacterized protein n=1 Tax=Liparis tanakae TaxID=230148 RepID=A0A4Z2HZ88_9TELE|nr:hypothetical protein EYF80_018517 [Liparis tanakae]
MRSVLSIVQSQQHGLLHGERLLPVVWSSEQLGGLLLLELSPVVERAATAATAVGVRRERELLDGRHLGLLEAGRARHPVLRRPREPDVRGPPGPDAFRQVVRHRLAPLPPLKLVHLRAGVELLQVDGCGAPVGLQMHRGGPGAPVGARRRRPAVAGIGVVHERLLRGVSVWALGGGVRPLPERHTGGRGEPRGRNEESLLAPGVQTRVCRL